MKKTIMLKKNYEFKYVFSRGKFYRGEFVEIYLLKNNFNINKIGIAISKKIGKSVVRNKIKRLIRENYRLAENSINTGNTIIFLWRKNIEINNATFENIKKDMKNIFKKANILIGEK